MTSPLPSESARNDFAPALDLAAIRAQLARAPGQQYWRSLEELANTPAFQDLLHREFPPGAAEWWDGLSRRSFLKMAAASLALAGLSACTKQPAEAILPYVNQPEELVLGKPLYYATAMLLGGFATGVLAKNREGHPIKIDGNPQHPAALGRSSIWMQASILGLYDPDRSQTVTFNGDISDWTRFLSDVTQFAMEERSRQGAGLRFLTEIVTSPTLAAQLSELLERFPEARWHQYEPVNRDNAREGSMLAFGEPVETQYHFEKAAVVVALDADFLYTHPERLRYTMDFTDGRRIRAGRQTLNRLYVLESTPTVTGSMADHRLPVRSGHIESLARWLAARLATPARGPAEPVTEREAHWLEAVARDLSEHRGGGIIIAGEWQPPIVHALAHAMNAQLGNTGVTLHYTDAATSRPVNQLQSLGELADDIQAGKVDTLFILGGNPVYSAPANVDFAALLTRIRRSVHVGEYLDETAARCTWHIPQSHYLESWGDGRSYDGTVSLQQPLIAPLYNGKSHHEVLAAVLQPQLAMSGYQVIRDFWRKQNVWPDFERGWRKALHDGFIEGTQLPRKEVRLRPLSDSSPPPPAQIPNAAIEPAIGNLEICFRPDPNLWDGRFANNGWLQECPKPISKLTWDNAVLISPALAEHAGLRTDDVVEVRFRSRLLRAPVLIMPGQAEHSITLHLGYGRTRVGRVGTGVGFNAGALREMDAFWFGQGASLQKTAERHSLVTTQNHQRLHSPERQIFRAATLQEFLAQPNIVQESVIEPPSAQTLYQPDLYPYAGYKWGMSIDLTTCIGCNACVVACNIENNIPVVGKDQVQRNREMLWIRVDSYFRGSLDEPQFGHMPVPCMHCEHAPCELVCPTAATVHDHEGLNVQVYNRCVGTRFCSNNCPYKVRRFNFLRYAPYDAPHIKPMYNPDVTVRWRGVMEKCTYCIQRIASARITAEKENRNIRDGEVVTACQQSCPADAIVFGDLNDPESRIAKLKTHPLDYAMLGQLNTRPRTTYIARIENRNPDVAELSPAARHPEV